MGGLLRLFGPDPVIDGQHKLLRGRLVLGGVDTGVELEVRAGGPEKGLQPVSALMATDHDVLLGQQATDEQVLGAGRGQPTVGVVAPFQRDPVVFIWDKSRHPEWNTVQDIGQTDSTVFTLHAATTDYLVGHGILRGRQLNYSYDGSPSWFMSNRDSAVGGFSINEPFLYRKLGRDVSYAYVTDTGVPNYRNTLTVRSADLSKWADCLRRLVPMIQRGYVDFMGDPEPVLKLIVAADEKYRAPYPYSIEQARYGVDVMRRDGLVTNGTDNVLGSFGSGRLQKVIDGLRPVYANYRPPVAVPDTLTADTIATNRFLDRGIRLPTG